MSDETHDGALSRAPALREAPGITPGTLLKTTRMCASGGEPVTGLHFDELMGSQSLYSAWRCRTEPGGQDVFAKVEHRQAASKSHEAGTATERCRRLSEAINCHEEDGNPVRARWNEETRWVDGYGRVFDSTLLMATSEAWGLGMVDVAEIPWLREDDFAAKNLAWQRTFMAYAPDGVFPVGPDCCELENGGWALFYPFMHGRTLSDIMKNEPDRVGDVLTTVAQKIAVMRQNGYSHQDIKPQHIIVSDNGNVTLVDPGYREVNERHREKKGAYPDISFITTPRYYPLLRYSLDDRQALAVLVYEWLTGEHPFAGQYWDDFPKFYPAVAYDDSDLSLSRSAFVHSMPRRADRLSVGWWHFVHQLLCFEVELDEHALGRMALLVETKGQRWLLSDLIGLAARCGGHRDG